MPETSSPVAARRLQRRRCITTALDLVGILAAFAIAHWLRYEFQLGGEVADPNRVPVSDFASIGAAYLIVMLAALRMWGLYSRQQLSSWLDQVGRIVISALLAEAAIIVMSYLAREAFPPSSRLMFAYLGLLSVAIPASLRLVAHRFYVSRYRRGLGCERVLVAGRGVLAKMLMQQIRGNVGAGLVMVGFFDHLDDQSDFGRFPRLGDLSAVEETLIDRHADRLIIALPFRQSARINELIEICRRLGIRYTVVPDLLALQTGRVHTETIAGIPLFTLTANRITGINAMSKRALDLLLSTLLLVLLSPVLAFLALAIRLDSDGPALFGQTRIGRGNHPFRMLKFRSMVKSASLTRYEIFPQAAKEALFKPRTDPRTTRVGRFLRRTSLDEMPQLINVIRGEMSLVGPRAQIPDEVSNYDDYAHNRLLVSPGLTGLWQVSGRSNLGFEEMVMLDTYYVGHWSLGLDLKILLRTIPAVIGGEGAY